MGRFADFFREQNIPLDGQKRTKMLSLDGEFEETKAERDALKAENDNLRAQVNPLKREVERYKNELEKQKSSDLHLSEGETNVLSFMCQAPRELPAQSIASNLGISVIKAEVFLNKLRERGLVEYLITMGAPLEYYLTDDGKTYAVEQGWV